MPHERPPALPAPAAPERRILSGPAPEKKHVLPEPEKPLQLRGRVPEQKKKKLVIVDTSDAIDEEALDIAEAKLTAAKEERKGIGGFFTRIWKDNLWREYYRQKEKSEAKKTIIETGNLYAGETHDRIAHRQNMGAVVDRFSLDYAEAVHREAGETSEILDRENIDNRTVRSELHSLIRRYAAGEMNDADFEEAKHAAFGRLPGAKKQLVEKGMQYADNLLEIAKQVKQNVEHGAGKEALDFDFEVIVGKAKNGVRTKSQANKVDKIIERITESRVGRFVNEATVASAVGIVASVGQGLLQRVVRSKLLAWGTFGATAIFGGGLAGARESARLEQERRQHSREMAKGKSYEASKSPRREEMEQSRYHARPAQELASNLNSRLFRETKNEGRVDREMSSEDFASAMANLIEAESRISLSDKRGVDLLSYSNPLAIEQERLALDIARAEAKVKLREHLQRHPEHLSPELRGKTFDEILAAGRNLLEVAEGGLVKGDRGMEKQDARFKAMKRKKVAGAVVKGIATGLVVGGVVQEAGALLRGGQDGVFEGLFGHTKAGNSVTALEHLRRILGGEQPPVAPCGWQEHVIFSNHLRIPNGVDLVENEKGLFYLMKDGQPITGQFETDSDGMLTPKAIKILEGAGIHVKQGIQSISGMKMETVAESPQEFIDRHGGTNAIHRVRWYDNDTPKPEIDKNEKLLTWGGKHGVDARGNIVYSVRHMTADGSSIGKHSVDPLELARQGKLKLLISLAKETQRSVYEVPFDAKGNAVIDPNSYWAQAAFKMDASGHLVLDSHGHPIFDGKFAEVAHVISAKNGVENVGVMATDVGPGVGTIQEDILRPDVVDTNITTLELPSDYTVDIPPVIPFGPRTPLEPTGKKRREQGPTPPPVPVLPPRPDRKNLEDKGRILRPDRVLAGPASIPLHPELKGREPVRGLLSGPQEVPEQKQIGQGSKMEAYIRNLPPEYRHELQRMVDRAPKFDVENTKGILAIPLYDVDAMTAQGMLEKAMQNPHAHEYEIAIIQGQAPGSKQALTEEMVNKLKRKYPKARIVYFNRIIRPGAAKVKTGDLKKYFHDLLALRLQAAGVTEDNVPDIAWYTEKDYRRVVPRVTAEPVFGSGATPEKSPVSKPAEPAKPESPKEDSQEQSPEEQNRRVAKYRELISGIRRESEAAEAVAAPVPKPVTAPKPDVVAAATPNPDAASGKLKEKKKKKQKRSSREERRRRAEEEQGF